MDFKTLNVTTVSKTSSQKKTTMGSNIKSTTNDFEIFKVSSITLESNFCLDIVFGRKKKYILEKIDLLDIFKKIKSKNNGCRDDKTVSKHIISQTCDDYKQQQQSSFQLSESSTNPSLTDDIITKTNLRTKENNSDLDADLSKFLRNRMTSNKPTPFENDYFEMAVSSNQKISKNITEKEEDKDDIMFTNINTQNDLFKNDDNVNITRNQIDLFDKKNFFQNEKNENTIESLNLVKPQIMNVKEKADHLMNKSYLDERNISINFESLKKSSECTDKDLKTLSLDPLSTTNRQREKVGSNIIENNLFFNSKRSNNKTKSYKFSKYVFSEKRENKFAFYCHDIGSIEVLQELKKSKRSSYTAIACAYKERGINTNITKIRTRTQARIDFQVKEDYSNRYVFNQKNDAGFRGGVIEQNKTINYQENIDVIESTSHLHRYYTNKFDHNEEFDCDVEERSKGIKQINSKSENYDIQGDIKNTENKTNPNVIKEEKQLVITANNNFTRNICVENERNKNKISIPNLTNNDFVIIRYNNSFYAKLSNNTEKNKHGKVLLDLFMKKHNTYDKIILNDHNSLNDLIEKFKTATSTLKLLKLYTFCINTNPGPYFYHFDQAKIFLIKNDMVLKTYKPKFKLEMLCQKECIYVLKANNYLGILMEHEVISANKIRVVKKITTLLNITHDQIKKIRICFVVKNKMSMEFRSYFT